MSRTKAIVSGRSDAELIASSRAGDSDAYAELYNRHIDGARAAARALSRSRADTDDIVAEAFSRVLSALRRGGGPDVSFRPYLLTAVRNSFYDRARRAKREEVTDEPDDIVSLSALDAANSGEDRAMVAEAFASLPERWQLVLWHTEVEGMTAAEVAPLVGLAPNAASALAYRAREGLRQAYLQSHLKQNIPSECSECAPKLGAYVRDGLAARERRRVDDHLVHCDSCTRLLAELNEANGHLKAVLIPLFVGVPAAKYLAGLHAGNGLLSLIHNVPRPQQFAGGAVAAAATVAALTLSFVSLRDTDRAQSAGERPAAGRPVSGATVGSNGNVGDPANVQEGAAIGELSTVDAPQVDEPANPQDDSGTTGDDGGVIDDGAELDSSITAPADPSEPSANDPADDEPTASVPSAPTDSTIPQNEPTPPSQPVSEVTTPSTEPKPPAPSTTVLVASQPPANTTIVPANTTPTTIKPPPSIAPPETDPPQQLQPTISVSATGGTYAGGSVGVVVSVRNSPANEAAINPVVQVFVPAGFTFDTAKSMAPWKCKGPSPVVCEMANIAPNGSTSATVYLHVGPAVKGPVAFVASFSSDNLPPVTGRDEAQISNGIIADDLLFADTDKGSVLAIGNTNLTCDEAEEGCLDARSGVADGLLLNRQSFTMTQVNDPANVDSFNSSSAKLNLAVSSTVSRAFLFWGADLVAGGVTAPDTSAKGTVRVTDPHGVPTDVVGRASTYGDGTRYSALQDVTQIVGQGGAGVYQVANVQAAPGSGSFGGWSMIVVTHDETEPIRAIAVVAPAANVAPTSPFDTTIRVPILNSTRAITVAAVGFEGESGYKPDAFSLNGDQLVNEANPTNNQFNSSVSGAVNPTDVNAFGVDVDIFDTSITGPGVNLKATSANEAFHLAAIAVAVDL